MGITNEWPMYVDNVNDGGEHPWHDAKGKCSDIIGSGLSPHVILDRTSESQKLIYKDFHFQNLPNPGVPVKGLMVQFAVKAANNDSDGVQEGTVKIIANGKTSNGKCLLGGDCNDLYPTNWSYENTGASGDTWGVTWNTDDFKDNINPLPKVEVSNIIQDTLNEDITVQFEPECTFYIWW